VGPEIVVVGAVVVEVVAVVATVVSPDTSDGVSQAASRRVAAKMVRNLKRMGCPLEKSPDTGEEWVDLDLVITRPPLRKG
jgi:flagellar biosynthesis/type III secretory pathway M-ring protein FliF/YscJ